MVKANESVQTENYTPVSPKSFVLRINPRLACWSSLIISHWQGKHGRARGVVDGVDICNFCFINTFNKTAYRINKYKNSLFIIVLVIYIFFYPERFRQPKLEEGRLPTSELKQHSK